MTRPATDAEVLQLQQHALATSDAALRRLTYAALGHDSRVAMEPCTAAEIRTARIGVVDQLEMLRLMGEPLAIGGAL